MKSLQFKKSAIALLIIGLTLAVNAAVLGGKVHLSDFFRGGMVGVGIGLEIVAFIMLKRAKQQPAPATQRIQR